MRLPGGLAAHAESRRDRDPADACGGEAVHELLHPPVELTSARDEAAQIVEPCPGRSGRTCRPAPPVQFAARLLPCAPTPTLPHGRDLRPVERPSYLTGVPTNVPTPYGDPNRTGAIRHPCEASWRA
jgi:hypothetical protein